MKASERTSAVEGQGSPIPDRGQNLIGRQILDDTTREELQTVLGLWKQRVPEPFGRMAPVLDTDLSIFPNVFV
jgi:hypothetical protein